MASQLYETLGVPKTATREEIRTAYKKRALATHPDRLKQGASSRERAAADEQFRKVNDAYEVLYDEQKRREYDRHGVWPVPSPVDDPPPYPRSEDQRDDMSRPSPLSNNFPMFGFQPSFGMGSMFDELRFMQHGGPFEASPRVPFMGPVGFPFGAFDEVFNGMSQSFNRMHHMARQNPVRGSVRQYSESTCSSTINGRTETVQTVVDVDGNTHVTRRVNGRETYTLNGIEQPRSTDRSTGRVTMNPGQVYASAGGSGSGRRPVQSSSHGARDADDRMSGPSRFREHLSSSESSSYSARMRTNNHDHSRRASQELNDSGRQSGRSHPVGDFRDAEGTRATRRSSNGWRD